MYIVREILEKEINDSTVMIGLLKTHLNNYEGVATADQLVLDKKKSALARHEETVAQCEKALKLLENETW